MLAEAVAAHRQALEVFSRETLPQDWAIAQGNLGIALHAQGTRTSGERGAQLLAEAVAAHRQTLEVFSRNTATTVGHGPGQSRQCPARSGYSTSGERGAQLLAEASAAHRQALEVFSRETLPQDWAIAQGNLGIALHDQGTRTSGERGAQLLAEAVAAHRQTLEVFSRRHCHNSGHKPIIT